MSDGGVQVTAAGRSLKLWFADTLVFLWRNRTEAFFSLLAGPWLIMILSGGETAPFVVKFICAGALGIATLAFLAWIGLNCYGAGLELADRVARRSWTPSRGPNAPVKLEIAELGIPGWVEITVQYRVLVILIALAIEYSMRLGWILPASWFVFLAMGMVAHRTISKVDPPKADLALGKDPLEELA